MGSKHPAVICFVLVAQLAGGTTFPLKAGAGQKNLGLADPSSSQLAVDETKTPELLPEFDPNNPQAKGIILAFTDGLMKTNKESFLKRQWRRGSRRLKRSPVSRLGFLNGVNGERRQWLRRSAAACRTFLSGVL